MSENLDFYDLAELKQRYQIAINEYEDALNSLDCPDLEELKILFNKAERAWYALCSANHP